MGTPYRTHAGEHEPQDDSPRVEYATWSVVLLLYVASAVRVGGAVLDGETFEAEASLAALVVVVVTAVMLRAAWRSLLRRLRVAAVSERPGRSAAREAARVADA